MELPELHADEWYARPGPILTVWIPAPEANADPRERLRLEWKHAREQVPDAPAAAISAIDALVDAERHHVEFHSLFLVADADGAVAGAPLRDGPDSARASCDELPHLGPILRAVQEFVPHVVVVTDRVGADIHLVGLGEEETEHVDGAELHIHRGKPGGWSQRRFQQRAENTWEHNAKGVAEEVDAARRKVGARLVAVAGDPRAVQFLTEHASSELAAVLRHIEGAGRSDADPFGELEPELERLVADVAASDTVATLDAFHEARQTGHAADGPEAALRALSEGRAANVVIHDDPDDDRQAYVARDARQVATEESTLRELGLEPRPARLVDAALWAAFTTGAGYRLVPAAGPKAPRDRIGAVLRG
ncbi:MAG: hypothetical protein JJU45_12590 [Acidimicrobiia bacterium]|nr:hypothetical protein [Acidimicrobiia bacterium]